MLFCEFDRFCYWRVYKCCIIIVAPPPPMLYHHCGSRLVLLAKRTNKSESRKTVACIEIAESTEPAYTINTIVSNFLASYLLYY